jgi:KDO2-lipid IV(A) lauroyltransferase
VTGHVGNWELLAAGLGARGHDVRPFARESYDPRMTELIDAWRRAVGVRTIWRRRGDVEAAVAETLDGGGIVGVLMDQDTRVRGAFVPFFGREAWTPTGAAELALSTGAPLLAGFVRRRAGGHEIRVERVPLPDGEGPEAVRELTAELTGRIEATIRERPEQWVWMHQRWRTRPESVEPT